MKSKRAFRIVRNVLLTIVFLTGLILISTNFIKNHIRKQVSVTAIEAVESVIDDGGGEITIEVPAVDFLKVDGENGEEDKSLEELIREMQSLSSEHESITLLGILEIPCIELKETSFEDFTSYDNCANIGQDIVITFESDEVLSFNNLYVGTNALGSVVDGVDTITFENTDNTYTITIPADLVIENDIYNYYYLVLNVGEGTDNTLNLAYRVV